MAHYRSTFTTSIHGPTSTIPSLCAPSLITSCSKFPAFVSYSTLLVLFGDRAVVSKKFYAKERSSLSLQVASARRFIQNITSKFGVNEMVLPKLLKQLKCRLCQCLQKM